MKTIEVGDSLPSVRICLKGVEVDIREHFATRTGIIFGVPGAFTPTCSEKHLPGFRSAAKELKGKIDFLGCVAVNDPYVLRAWAKSVGVSDEITFIADVDAILTKRLGMHDDMSSKSMGLRSKRFALYIGKGAVVRYVAFDDESFAEAFVVEVEKLIASDAPSRQSSHSSSNESAKSPATVGTDLGTLAAERAVDAQQEPSQKVTALAEAAIVDVRKTVDDISEARHEIERAQDSIREVVRAIRGN